MGDYERLQHEADALLLPAFYRQVVWNPQGGITQASQLDAAGFALVERAFAVMKRTVKRMHDAGVRLHSGTDTLVAFVVPGAALHRELRIYVDAGMTPEEALAISTRDSAADFGVPGLGEIRPGAPADLVVFREDPTRNLAALDSIEAVIRDGRLYTRAALDGQLARYRAHFSSRAFDAIITPLVRRVVGSARD
jgi:Amidohydrolase family